MACTNCQQQALLEGATDNTNNKNKATVMPDLTLERFLVESFDEAVERLTHFRDSGLDKPARIELAFPTDNLPDELISEFRKEAASIGLMVCVAA